MKTRAKRQQCIYEAKNFVDTLPNFYKNSIKNHLISLYWQHIAAKLRIYPIEQ